MSPVPYTPEMYFDQQATVVGDYFPPPRYHGTPRFVVTGSKLEPRVFPINIPLGPHRRPTPFRYPPSLGLGRGVDLIPHQDKLTGYESTKTCLRSLLPPIDKKKEPADTSAEELPDEDATDEDPLPTLCHFPKADMVRYAKNILEPRPGIWQEVVADWERAQIRYNHYRSYEVERRGARPFNRLTKTESIKRVDYDKRVRQLLPDIETKKAPTFTRPMPGYGGYVPRYPVDPRPPEECPNVGLTNISRTTYKLFPQYAYTRQEFAHEGPLSSNVTTTHPFNPFNKVDRLGWNSNKLMRKRRNQPKVRPK